jgi:hypothetical protein
MTIRKEGQLLERGMSVAKTTSGGGKIYEKVNCLAG